MSSVFDQSVPLNAGPWYIGELLTGVYGLVGVHGVIVAGHFLPGSLTYLDGVLQVRRGERMVLYSATKEEEEVKEVFSALIFFLPPPPSCFDCPPCVQVLLFQVPLVCYLNSLLSHNHSCGCRPLPCHLSMLVVFLLQCRSILNTTPYGPVAVLISPGVSWSLPLSLYLIVQALRTNSRNSLRTPQSN